MKLAIYIGKKGIECSQRLAELQAALETAGFNCRLLEDGQTPEEGTDMLLSVGGDGTFLSASAIAAGTDIPVAGVNMGRLGFLSENRPEDVAEALLSGDYTIEERTVLGVCPEGDSGFGSDFWPYAFNEFTVHRSGAAMLGVDVSIDGVDLPAYWADGLIISTSSGSTAYSLSAGGPIALPQAKVLIITPIAPHNLNVRPLVVPDSAKIRLKVHSRDSKIIFTADNMTAEIGEGTSFSVSVAQFSLKRVRLNSSNFINALTEKLFWGEDVRNIK